jgi:type IV pilus assembly protein PilC
MPLQKTTKAKPARTVQAAVEPRGKPAGALFRKRVSPKALMQFTVQLATLQNAGLPLVRSLKILEGQMRPGPFKDVLAVVTDDVEGGSSLSEALAKRPEIFDRLYVNMVRAGETGGVLDQILTRLGEFMEKSENIKSRIKEALTYPTLVMLFAAGILVFIMLVVVPKFNSIFETFNEELPLPTQFLIGFSRSLVNQWYLYIAVPILLWVCYKWALRSEAFRFKRDNLYLHLPIAGDMTQKAIVSRFSRTLGTLLRSGVPILEGLAIVKESISNAVLMKAVGEVHDSIREGENIAPPLGESGIFDDLVVNMIDVGEATGTLDQMLLKIADTYDTEVDIKVSTLFKAIEPTVIIVLAAVVGFIVMALFLPILKMLNTLGAQ